MTVTQTKRRRRSPEEARNEILDAAEEILVAQGPADLKFQHIAKQAGVSQSNAHHHFGGVVEIRKALVARLLQRLTDDLTVALASSEHDRKRRVEQVVPDIYRILATERYAKVIAWVVLSEDRDQIADIVEPLGVIVELVKSKFAEFLSPKKSAQLAREIIYQVAITSIGDGLVGDNIRGVFGKDGARLDGSQLIVEMVLAHIVGS